MGNEKTTGAAVESKKVVFVNESGRGLLVTAAEAKELNEKAERLAYIKRTKNPCRIVQPGSPEYAKLEKVALGGNYDTKTGSFIKDE